MEIHCTVLARLYEKLNMNKWVANGFENGMLGLPDLCTLSVF